MGKSLAEAIVAAGVANQATVRRAEEEAQRTGCSFLMGLLAQPGVDADLVGMMTARHYGLAYSHLVPGTVAGDLVVALDLMKLRRLQVLPVDRKGSHVTFAAADPGVRSEVERLVAGKNLTIDWVAVPMKEIEAELERLLPRGLENPAAPSSQPVSSGGAVRPASGLRPAASASGSSAGAVVVSVKPGAGNFSARFASVVAGGDAPAIVSEIVAAAVAMGASDAHIVLDGARLAVRFRKDGALRDLEAPCTPAVSSAVISRIKVISEMNISETRLPQDGRTRVQVTGQGAPLSVLMRVSTIPTRQGEKVTLRILERGSTVPGLAEIGLSKENLQLMNDALLHPNGTVLVTGPTGSGKTTTVYAALQHVNDRSVSLFTLEDPIEFEMPGTYQTQIHDAIELTFPVMLRALLRQDPNVIMVGEMRDSETAKIAFEAGLTGHFVISTLHANSATTAITRLLEMGVEPFVIGTCTRAIVAQRLVRLLCSCKRPIYRMPDELARIKEALGLSGSRVCEAAGCPECSFIGYNGRIAIHEVLTMFPALTELVLNRASATELLTAARAGGFKPMMVDGFSKVLAGLTTAAEVVRQIGPPQLA
ncbi:MAG: type II/IV secretion system protein [Candidatus Wallbacteria bacterium]|nr:type II/IV secretion system protein [Candidatus Wallbacteria bacterium]